MPVHFFVCKGGGVIPSLKQSVQCSTWRTGAQKVCWNKIALRRIIFSYKKKVTQMLMVALWAKICAESHSQSCQLNWCHPHKSIFCISIYCKFDFVLFFQERIVGQLWDTLGGTEAITGGPDQNNQQRQRVVPIEHIISPFYSYARGARGSNFRSIFVFLTHRLIISLHPSTQGTYSARF